MDQNMVLYDDFKGILSNGSFTGCSIITKCQDSSNSIIFSDNITISEDQKIVIKEGLKIGFSLNLNKETAFSEKRDFTWEEDFTSLEYSVLIPERVMELYDEGRFSESYPFTINLLHTAGLFFRTANGGNLNHLDFVIGEIIKNPICLIENGIIVADRVVIDDRGDPVFYDCIIVGRDQEDNLSVSYEPFANVSEGLIYIIILGKESLRE